MSDIGAPQDHHGFTLTNEEYASILALNGRSTPDPLDYWNDLRFTYRTSDAFLDNYLELRLAGYNHDQSVELSHKLDRQFNDRAEAGMLSPSHTGHGTITWVAGHGMRQMRHKTHVLGCVSFQRILTNKSRS